MIQVKEAQKLILSQDLPSSTSKIPLQQAVGRILAQDINADRDSPPFDRVTMDGIAIQASRFSPEKYFFIENTQAAGQPPLTLSDPEHCLEVMTGAVLPLQTDCVIPYECVVIADGKARIDLSDVSAFQNIHGQGTDARKGDVLIPKGSTITAGMVGVMAAVGYTHVSVVSPPKVVVCATGDELVPVDQTPLPHQIRNSNSYMLQAALLALGIKADTVQIADDRDKLRDGLKKLVGNYDVLMFSGAVSKGKFDYLPEVLEELGLDKKIHGVAQRPGKPFLFGTVGKTLVFGFPGNPGSTLVCFHAYFKPWLRKYQGLAEKHLYATLTSDLVFKKPLTYHLLVTFEDKDSVLLASPVDHSGSGDLVHLGLADGFVSLPAGKDFWKAGSLVPLIRFD
ncbi:molybdopterin molybdotransferase MoeA [Lunatibacter salilacus]|uniref:molybdopterin molybdotransferase MoeA n=1 Tax=Lunatibacter salilacus TaxID=2483804 RepID=UPI00131B2CDB|nr:molybdopterin molybdotransferase MoeA [Lunatibacter salilacus]